MHKLMLPLLLISAIAITTPAWSAPDGDTPHYFTEDDNHDGIPNWADPESDLFALRGVLFHVINLSLFLGVAWYVARKPLGDVLRDRARSIRGEITDSARERDEAKQRFAELEARLAAISDEVEAMRANAQEEARVEEENLLQRAQEEAARIAQTAQRNVRDEVTRARLELRREAVDLAVQLAEGALREQVNHDDQTRLAREFLDSLNTQEPGHV